MRKKIILAISVLIIVVGVPILADYYLWRKAEAAAVAMPYQIGLTNVVITPCFIAYGKCVGAPLCIASGTDRCAGWSSVIGTPAGGMGASALFSAKAIAMAGLTAGGQLIAGGMGPTMMDQGVLASAGGCSGCSLASRTDKTMNWLSKFSIASLIK